MGGFHDAMLLSAGLALTAGVLGFLLIRTQDLHPSVLVSQIPPDVDDLDEADVPEVAVAT
jgi:hypothetical protein